MTLTGESMKKIRIMSLGDIVTPNLGKGIMKLASIIGEKKSTAPDVSQVQSIVLSNSSAIEQFKQGLSEQAFDNLFLKAFDAIGVELTTEDFNTAWAEMNPDYATFKSALDAATAFHAQDHQELILISYTNPKDLRQLRAQLQNNNIPFETKKDNLSSIAGIKLYASYVHKIPKAMLLENILLELRPSDTQRHGFFAESQNDIKYIHSASELKDPAMKNLLQNQSIASAIWDKESTSLAQILNNEAPRPHVTPAFS
jgi:hypothetical protein